MKGLAAMPRGGLREWLRLAKVDPRRAEAHWHRTLEVMRTTSEEKRDDAARLLAALQALNGAAQPFDDAGSTPLLDAATWMSLEKQGAR